jgi:hypothetical protein
VTSADEGSGLPRRRRSLSEVALVGVSVALLVAGVLALVAAYDQATYTFGDSMEYELSAAGDLVSCTALGRPCGRVPALFSMPGVLAAPFLTAGLVGAVLTLALRASRASRRRHFEEETPDTVDAGTADPDAISERAAPRRQTRHGSDDLTRYMPPEH